MNALGLAPHQLTPAHRTPIPTEIIDSTASTVRTAIAQAIANPRQLPISPDLTDEAIACAAAAWLKIFPGFELHHGQVYLMAVGIQEELSRIMQTSTRVNPKLTAPIVAVDEIEDIHADDDEDA